MKKMGKPPYHDATPTRMSRSGGSSKTGNTFRVPSNAKYGVDGSQKTVRMSRKVGKGKSGNSWVNPAQGPARASRKDTGANTYAAKSYGVAGVSVKDNGGRYGV